MSGTLRLCKTIWDGNVENGARKRWFQLWNNWSTRVLQTARSLKDKGDVAGIQRVSVGSDIQMDYQAAAWWSCDLPSNILLVSFGLQSFVSAKRFYLFIDAVCGISNGPYHFRWELSHAYFDRKRTPVCPQPWHVTTDGLTHISAYWQSLQRVDVQQERFLRIPGWLLTRHLLPVWLRLIQAYDFHKLFVGPDDMTEVHFFWIHIPICPDMEVCWLGRLKVHTISPYPSNSSRLCIRKLDMSTSSLIPYREGFVKSFFWHWSSTVRLWYRFESTVLQCCILWQDSWITWLTRHTNSYLYTYFIRVTVKTHRVYPWV